MQLRQSSDTGEGDPTPLRSIGFHDVPHPKALRSAVRWTTIIVAIPIGFALLALVVVLAMLPPPVNWITLPCVIIPIVVLLWREMERPSSRIVEVLENHRLEGLGVVLDKLFPNDHAPLLWNIASIATALARDARCGVSCRICLPNRAVPVRPIERVFETLPLDETDPHFNDLDSEDQSQNDKGNPTGSEGNRDDNQFVRRLRRNFAFSGGWLSIAFFAYIFAMAAWEAWQTKRITPHLLMWGLILGTTIFGVGGRGAWTQRCKWILLPGAVILERSVWFSGSPTRLAFPRPESVLFVHQSSRRTWTAHLAGLRKTESVQVTDREATMLLRTWLSPVPEETTKRLIAAALS